MQRISISLLSAGLLASVVTAQVGPGMTDADPVSTGQQAMVTSTYFSTNAGTVTDPTMGDIPGIWTALGTNITQVSLGKTGIAGLAAGEYHMCITTSGLTSTYNPQGSGDVLMGMVTWNSGSPVFTPNTMANNLNSPGNDFGLMIDGVDGTFAAIDYPAGPMLSERTSNAVDFPAPVAITGAGGTYVDPAPGHVDGVFGLFWVSGATSISWAPLNLTRSGGMLTAAAIDAANTVVMISTSNQPHSPTPLFGANGDSHGMWFSRVTSGDSDEYFTGHLPTATGGSLVYDSTAWSNNGGIAGSHFLAAYSGHYNTLLEGRGSSMLVNSDIAVGAGATLDISISAPTGTPPLFTSRIAIGLSTGPGIPLGGILGELGLNPATLALIIGGPTGTTADETANVSFPATDPSLVGVSLAMQALTVPISGQPAFTNTVETSFK